MGSSQRTSSQRSDSHSLKKHSAKTYDLEHGGSTMREEDILPLQNFEGAIGKDNVERKVKQNATGKDANETTEFKPGLHIHGDISTSRPFHFKRWDSEARIGGGHGVEEVEDRI